MDRQTAEHFYAWLERVVHESEQHEVEQRIHALLRSYPDLVLTHSWPEMRALADRMAERDPLPGYTQRYHYSANKVRV